MCNELSARLNETPEKREDVPASPQSVGVRNSRPKVKNDLEVRVDAIEQKGNSHILLCSGPSVVNLIRDYPESLVENTTSEVKRILPSIIEDSDIRKVAVFGKNRTHIKIQCTSDGVKRKIINAARRSKPEHMYFSEFLTPYRSKILYALRCLKRKYPTKIAAVYTRGGNIFYKLNRSETFVKVLCPTDVAELEKRLVEAE